MKIDFTIEKSDKVTVDKLESGDMFLYAGELYAKTDEKHIDGAIKCFSFSDGILVHFENTRIITKMKQIEPLKVSVEV